MVRTSIIIPTRDRAELVTKAVRSALEIEGGMREVIVVDDGSSDGTVDALALFGDAISVIRERGRGKSQARNAGLERARGDWISFLDDDDLYLSSGLPLLEEALAGASPSVGLVYGDAQYIKTDPSNPLVGSLPAGHGQSGWVLQQLLRGSFMVTGTMLVRREAVLAAGGFDLTLPFVQDYDLWLRVAQRGAFQYVSTEVCQVRLHETNSTRNIAEAGRLTEQVKERHLLSPECLIYARGRLKAGEPSVGSELSQLCLDLSLRRWWEGKLAVSRASFLQAVRLSPRTALPKFRQLWRAWVPVRRPVFSDLRPKSCSGRTNDAGQRQ